MEKIIIYLFLILLLFVLFLFILVNSVSFIGGTEVPAILVVGFSILSTLQLWTIIIILNNNKKI